MAQRIVRDPQHAEDVLQDAFMQVWQHAGSFKAELGSARGWIYTIVRHRALKALRDDGREQTMDPQDLSELADTNARPQPTTPNRARSTPTAWSAACSAWTKPAAPAWCMPSSTA